MTDFKPKDIENIINFLSVEKSHYGVEGNDSGIETAVGRAVLADKDYNIINKALWLLYSRESDRVRLQKRIKDIFGNQKDKK